MRVLVTIQHGENVHLFKHAIRELVADGGAGGRERVASYDCPAMGERIREIYEGVLDGGSGAVSPTPARTSTGGDAVSD